MPHHSLACVRLAPCDLCIKLSVELLGAPNAWSIASISPPLLVKRSLLFSGASLERTVPKKCKTSLGSHFEIAYLSEMLLKGRMPLWRNNEQCTLGYCWLQLQRFPLCRSFWLFLHLKLWCPVTDFYLKSRHSDQ